MIRLFVWLLKTAAMIVVFHLVIPPVVHSYTTCQRIASATLAIRWQGKFSSSVLVRR